MVSFIEALGLAKEDIKLEEPIPHIRLISHPWRRLKTRSSHRYIPLVKSLCRQGLQSIIM